MISSPAKHTFHPSYHVLSFCAYKLPLSFEAPLLNTYKAVRGHFGCKSSDQMYTSTAVERNCCLGMLMHFTAYKESLHCLSQVQTLTMQMSKVLQSMQPLTDVIKHKPGFTGDLQEVGMSSFPLTPLLSTLICRTLLYPFLSQPHLGHPCTTRVAGNKRNSSFLIHTSVRGISLLRKANSRWNQVCLLLWRLEIFALP